MLKILTNNCDREAINYIPSRDLWINRLHFSISNEQKSSCLTIDCRNTGPAKYRTNADNDLLLRTEKKDRLYNKFLAKRINKDDENISFQIDSVINTSKNGEIKFYKAVDELKSLKKTMAEIMLENNMQNKLHSLICKTVEEERKMEEDLDLLYDNNGSQQKNDEKEKTTSRRKI